MKRLLFVLLFLVLLLSGCTDSKYEYESRAQVIIESIVDDILDVVSDYTVPDIKESYSSTNTAEVATIIESTFIIETEYESTIKVENSFTFEELSQYMYTTANVNIRDLPSKEGNIVYVLEAGERVYISGRCIETGWYRMEQEGQIFYISDKYIEEN